MKIQILICYALCVTGLGLALHSSAASAAPDAAPELAEAAPVAVEVAEPDPGDALGGILEAVRGGRWLVAVGGVLWLFVYLLRSARLRALLPFLGTRIGGYVVALGVPALAVIAAALYEGADLGADLIFGAVGAGLVAIGLHQGRKDATGGQ